METNSDLGIALDGDGDRVGLIDNKGNIIFPDTYMMLLAEDLLRKNSEGSIVFDVKCSTNLEKVIKILMEPQSCHELGIHTLNQK